MIGLQIGNYRIVKQIGEGGMGAVYLGEHLTIGRRAAIKVLLPGISSHPEMVQRFFNEARIKGRVDHPGLVDVFDFGQLEDGSAYLVMEFLSGESLAQKITREQPLPLPQILTIGRQMCAAIGAAHGQNVIHRDLKPDNIFLTRDEELAFGIRVKVLDFGIAKLAGDPAAGVQTRTTAIFGTPAYMSPEQCRGASLVDQRSDVYSVGCILFEMATGRRPFAGELGELLSAHLRDAPPLPRSLAPSIAPALEAFILRTLEKNPAARPQTMAEMIAALDAMGRPSAQMPLAHAASGNALAPPSVEQPRTTPAPSERASHPDTAVLPSLTPPLVASRTVPVEPESSSRAPLVLAMFTLAILVASGLAWRHARDAASTPTATSSPAAIPTPAGTTPPADPPPLGMIPIHGGKMTIGRDDYGKLYRLDMPAHVVDVKPFAIDTTEVSNRAYREFVDAGFAKPLWPKKIKNPDQFFDLPIVSITRGDAQRYCQWRYPGKGRLPSENEWETAAAGAGVHRLYPWGDAPRAECRAAAGAPVAIGSIACSATPEGVMDLSGNVWEWTSSPASIYPGSRLTAPPGDQFWVIRGGSYFNRDWDDVTTTNRQFVAQPSAYLGFRCAADL